MPLNVSLLIFHADQCNVLVQGEKGLAAAMSRSLLLLIASDFMIL